MIEIIQEENWDELQERRGLPKSIKQMGTPDAGDRIYIENEAYQKMHPYGKCPERMVYVLMGHFDNFAGSDCTFVEDVVEMHEIEFQGNLPIWTDESWGCLYRKLMPEHEDMVIVGWAVDICGQLPSMSAQLEHIHQSYFGGTHQILLLLDSLEREEVVYSNRSGYLKRRTGFYICNSKVSLKRGETSKPYYEQEVYREPKRHAGRDDFAKEAYRASEEEFRRQESYREYLNQRRMRGGNRRMRPQPQNQGSYVSTILLVLVIVALGYSAIQNQKKAKEMEQALAQISQLQTSTQTEWGTDSVVTGTGNESVIRVEEIVGSIVPDTSQAEMTTQNEAQQGTVESTQVSSVQTENMQTEQTQVESTQISQSQNGNAESVQTGTSLSESELYLQQGYYIVQQGDSLAGICQKIYHTSAMMEQICQLNGIENPDAIYAGQYLELP